MTSQTKLLDPFEDHDDINNSILTEVVERSFAFSVANLEVFKGLW